MNTKSHLTGKFVSLDQAITLIANLSRQLRSETGLFCLEDPQPMITPRSDIDKPFVSNKDRV